MMVLLDTRLIDEPLQRFHGSYRGRLLINKFPWEVGMALL